MIRQLVSELFGLLALILIGISLSKNNKKNLLRYQLYANIAYSMQYIAINAYSGLLMYLTCIIRNYIFSKYKKVPLYNLLIILLIMLILSTISYVNIYSLLPLIGIGINTIGIWQNNMTITRISEVVACILVTIYNIIVGAYLGAVATTLELTMSLISIYRFDIKKRGNTNE